MNPFLKLKNLSIVNKSLLLLVGLFFIYGLGIHFFDGILPIHEWRKTDSLSLTWNYANGATLLSPETNFISNAGNQKAAAEFPIVYFVVGKIWCIFGKYEWLAKLISFSTLFYALALFGKVVDHFYKNQRKTLIFIGIIFSSPVLIYYSDTLLPNVFAFAFLLYASYFLYALLIEKRKNSWIYFTLFLTMAILIKVTVLIAVLTFCGAALFYYLFHERNLFSTNRRNFLMILGSFGVALLCTYFWYTYAIKYNEKYSSTLFSTTIRPIWEVDAQRRKEIWDLIWKYQFDMLYHHIILIPSILFVLYLAIRKKISAFFIWAIIIGLLGLTTYFILWFWVFDVHDYYLIEALFFPLIFLFVSIFKFNDIFENHKKTLWIISYTFITATILQVISYTQIAFGNDNVITKNTFFVSKFVKGNWGYFHWYHGDHLKKLQDQTSEIQEIIKKDDTVLCITDPSPNIQLYTIKRFGYTLQNFFDGGDKKVRIGELINKGADFMLVVGPEPLDSAVLNYTEVEVYAKNNIRVFDLNSFKSKNQIKPL